MSKRLRSFCECSVETRVLSSEGRINSWAGILFAPGDWLMPDSDEHGADSWQGFGELVLLFFFFCFYLFGKALVNLKQPAHLQTWRTVLDGAKGCINEVPYLSVVLNLFIHSQHLFVFYIYFGCILF